MTVVDVATLDADVFNTELEPHTLTDKENTKVLPCRSCRRACVVNAFAAPAKTECMECRGDTQQDSRGRLGAPLPGRTAPEKAANLADCLINKQFAYAVCPFDPDHNIELKSVSHAPNYGPTKVVGFKAGQPVYSTETGESVMLQCNDCKTTVSYSTQHLQVYRRQNEAKVRDSSGSGWTWLLGERETDETPQ